MKLNITLKDSKLCNGCPCFKQGEKMQLDSYCTKYWKYLEIYRNDEFERKYFRINTCIDENGN